MRPFALQTTKLSVNFRVQSGSGGGLDSNWPRALTVEEGVGGGGAVVLLVRDAAGIEGGLLLRLLRLERLAAHVAVVAARAPEALQTTREEGFVDELAVAE